MQQMFANQHDMMIEREQAQIRLNLLEKEHRMKELHSAAATAAPAVAAAV